MVETIYGCKWSLTVYQLLANGINRPGEMVRSVEGLSTKVLNECLKRNVEFDEKKFKMDDFVSKLSDDNLKMEIKS